MKLPTAVSLHTQSGDLSLQWPDTTSFRLSGEFLRVFSPSAEEANRVVFGKQHVKATACEYVGRYALKISFSDGHESGLFTWLFLEKLCLEQESLWQDYLAQLEDKQLSRDPDVQVLTFPPTNEDPV